MTNIIAELIGKEARYMMGVEPELHIVPKEKGQQGGAGERGHHRRLADRAAGRTEVEQEAAGRGEDFIGKRVALKLTGRRGGKLGIQFRPSLEFVARH